MMGVNETISSSGGVIYWALNGYGVSAFDLFINMLTMFLAVWIIVLNLLVLHALLRIAPSREPTDLFICSLAMADALSGVFLLYNTTYNLANYQIFHECAFRLGILQVVRISAVYHMSALTIDRYIKIVQPYHYSTVCHNMSVIAVSITIWILSVVFGLLPLMKWNSASQPNSNDPVCGFFVVFNHSYLTFTAILFLFPFFLMIVLYMHIFKIARRHAKLIAVQERVQTKDKHSWKYTKTVCLIIGIYFISWMPSGFLIMVDLGGYLDNFTTVEKGTLLLYVASAVLFNGLVNPIIYAFKITTVRMRFRAIFCRKSIRPSDFEQSRTDAKGPTSRSQGTTLVTTIGSQIDN